MSVVTAGLPSGMDKRLPAELAKKEEAIITMDGSELLNGHHLASRVGLSLISRLWKSACSEWRKKVIRLLTI